MFGRHGEDLVDYLNDNPLNLMLDDWSTHLRPRAFSRAK